jgi:predicted Zn-dependent peptidase
LPANQLELAIFLEADRMRAPAITQANFDNQRATVQEERRQNYDNRAYGKSYEATIDLVYDNFAYKHSTIGSMDDLNAATIHDAEAFFKTYYAPNNAVLSLVGNFQSDAALALIKKYFENIPAQTPPPVPDVSEPEQKGRKAQSVGRQLRANAAARYCIQDTAGKHARLVCAGSLGKCVIQRRLVAAVSEIRQRKRNSP